MNLGISEGFATIDFPNLIFPFEMQVDYIRVYQHEDEYNIGCDPAGYPTTKYIEKCVTLRD